MRVRYLFGILLVSAFAAGSVPLPSALICLPGAAFLTPTAQAAQIRTKFRSLLDRVLGRSMPDGIYKTNGRIEATQVVVAAKYPGRLTDITVKEGSEVKAGQAVGRVSSPQFEAQRRAAQANLDKAGQALTEVEHLINERQAVLAAAKSDFERGQELVGRQIITQQTFDQRRRNYEGAEANVQGAIAQREQADHAIKSAQAEVERIDSTTTVLSVVPAVNFSHRTGVGTMEWWSGRA